jgi:hypothetical protein
MPDQCHHHYHPRYGEDTQTLDQLAVRRLVVQKEDTKTWDQLVGTPDQRNAVKRDGMERNGMERDGMERDGMERGEKYPYAVRILARMQTPHHTTRLHIRLRSCAF